MKKLLVSDYDQTFYLDDDDIEKNKIKIEKFRQQENIFVIATGRSKYHFNIKKEEYDIKYDYVILNHGAEIRDSNDNLIYSVTIDNNIKNKLKEDLNLEESVHNLNFTIQEHNVSIDKNELLKINIKYNTYEEAITILNKIKEKYKDYINIYYVNNNSIEIISNKISKVEAIKLLLEKIHIEKELVYTIGDNYSDIEMIKEFNGYCMKDSIEELKSIAIEEVTSVSNLIDKLIV